MGDESFVFVRRFNRGRRFVHWIYSKICLILRKKAKAKRDHIRIGTRKVPLPYGRLNILVQSYNVCTQTLRSSWFTLIQKRGTYLGEPLAQVGGKGLFTAELEESLHKGDIDIAVRIARKIRPTELPEGLTLGAISAREVPTMRL